MAKGNKIINTVSFPSIIKLIKQIYKSEFQDI